MIHWLGPLPIPVRYVPEIPTRKNGSTVAGRMTTMYLWPTVLIRADRRGDEGLLAHEIEHVKQLIFGLYFGHLLLYRFCTYYRAQCEVRAFLVQLEYEPRNWFRFVESVATWYDLGWTEDDVEKLFWRLDT